MPEILYKIWLLAPLGILAPQGGASGARLRRYTARKQELFLATASVARRPAPLVVQCYSMLQLFSERYDPALAPAAFHVQESASNSLPHPATVTFWPSTMSPVDRTLSAWQKAFLDILPSLQSAPWTVWRCWMGYLNIFEIFAYLVWICLILLRSFKWEKQCKTIPHSLACILRGGRQTPFPLKQHYCMIFFS